MKRTIIFFSIIAAVCGMSFAQSAIGAYSMSQPDLKGTARYMGMAGAFGALGGDLSAISQNPAGIGVYRSSDIGFTLDLDLQNSNVTTNGGNFGLDQTKFLLNNIGGVLTLRLSSNSCPNLNFGFTYNKSASFNRTFTGNFASIKNSMTNYIAGVTNSYGVTEGDMTTDMSYNPYEPGYYDGAPWLSILGYDSYLINPDVNDLTGKTTWSGIWVNPNQAEGHSTSGSANFYLNEQGCTNDFNIVFGGNISDVLYWGMNFDIVNMNYRLSTVWGENLTDAIVQGSGGNLAWGNAQWDLNTFYSLSGTGFQYQFGLIVKPVQALRLGFAFHTPTWYTINEQFSGLINYDIGSEYGWTYTNDGLPGYNSYNFRTPWKILASAAGVIGNSLILSFDYEWANYGAMHFSEPNYYNDYWYDPWEPWSYAMLPAKAPVYNPTDPYGYENFDIATYYKSTNTFRVGVEFKPISALSIRAGYSYVSSPVTKEAKNNEVEIYTSSLTPSYRFDNTTNYITCGLGYRYQHVYLDLAYVYKRMASEYHAFAPDVAKNAIPSPQAKVDFTNNQVVLSLGYRF